MSDLVRRQAAIDFPLETTMPRVGLYTPVSMLKNVVLPAPFGPIRLTIALRGIEKSTSFTATSPPNSPELHRLENVPVLLCHQVRRSRRRGWTPSSNSALRRALGIRPSGRNSIIRMSARPKMPNLYLGTSTE